MSFLEPDPVLLGFIFFKSFVYLPVLALLALGRVIGGTGVARWPALAALILAVGGTVTELAPAAGLNAGPLYVSAAQAMARGGGMVVLLVASAVFLVSTVLPQARWRALDLLHGLLLVGLLGVWWWTS